MILERYGHFPIQKLEQRRILQLEEHLTLINGDIKMEHKKHGMHHKKHHEMKHKSEHHSKKLHHSGMIDNRHVNDNHQKGIERVKQRPGDMEVGQHGKMGMHHKHGDSFKRHSGKMTPSKG